MEKKEANKNEILFTIKDNRGKTTNMECIYKVTKRENNTKRVRKSRSNNEE